jgi:transposase
MSLYCGIDLHSTNSFVVVLDEEDRIVLEKRLPNRLEAVLGELEPIRKSLASIVVESTYNWYWLVDGLQAKGFAVSLANTAAIHQYEGLKYSDDRHDARWLAHLLRLGVLPTGYIYPPEARGLRDLMRRRHHLVRQRATCLITLKCLFARNTGVTVPTNVLRRMQPDDVLAQVADPHLALAIQSTIRVRERLDEETNALEKTVLAAARERPELQLLRSIPGVGTRIGLTILYETGDIQRFKAPWEQRTEYRQRTTRLKMHRPGRQQRPSPRDSDTSTPPESQQG